MAIFAISDLHLSFNRSVTLYDIDPTKDIDKPMDVFGWHDHYNQIRDNWQKRISDKDTVLLPGDISWALKLDVALYDFNWIDQLPGKKIISPGNHCYYAKSKSKMQAFLPDSITWLDADIKVIEGEHSDRVVAATRGWLLPGERGFRENRDRPIYERQVGRLRLALEKAHLLHPEKMKIVMLHYPPCTAACQESAFLDLLLEYDVPLCIYGHMHGSSATSATIQGKIDDTLELKLVACDALDFNPIKLLD